MEDQLFTFTFSLETLHTMSIFLGLLKFMVDKDARLAWVWSFFHVRNLLLHATLFKSIKEHAWSLKSNAEE